MKTPLVCVITLSGVPESVEASRRCIASAQSYGLEAHVWEAMPASAGREFFEQRGWPTEKFTRNRYSRPDPCMACFASHATLWALCEAQGEPIIVCEHDAVFVRPLPPIGASYAVNLGRPSFGRFKTPPCGVGPLVSKPHFPGAHCYLLRPQGAREFLRLAKTEAEPTDVFLSMARFPWLREAYPWVAECHEEITTIQREEGCKAKHRPVRIV